MSNFTIQELEFIKSELKYRANYAPEENTEEQNILYNSIDRKITVIIEQLNQTKKMSKEDKELHISDVSCSYIDQLGDKILEQRDIDRKWAEDRNIS